MKLVKVHIREFQSIQDSNEVRIGDVTCLVGKNESGKTALLKALYRLNPIVEEEGDFDVVLDYPRRFLSDYEDDVEARRREHAQVIPSGMNIWGRVQDTKHMVSTALGTRSRGFVWFFSFRWSWKSGIIERSFAGTALVERSPIRLA